MISLLQSKYLRYDLQAVLLPGMVACITISGTLTGSLAASLLLLKDISIGGATLFLIISYMVGKFVQINVTIGFEQKYWAPYGHPKFWILPEKDTKNSFLSKKVKNIVCKKISADAIPTAQEVDLFIPIITEQCYQLEHIRDLLIRTNTEAHMFRAFRLVFPMCMLSEIYLDILMFPYSELSHGFLSAIWVHFPFLRLFFSLFFGFVFYILSWAKYKQYKIQYYQILYRSYAYILDIGLNEEHPKVCQAAEETLH